MPHIFEAKHVTNRASTPFKLGRFVRCADIEMVLTTAKLNVCFGVLLRVLLYNSNGRNGSRIPIFSLTIVTSQITAWSILFYQTEVAAT